VHISDPINVVWAAVPGCDVLEVSNTGEVRATNSNVILRIGNTKVSGDGYRTLSVTQNGIHVSLPHCRIYRLIALTFYGPLPCGLITRHKNNIKTDDRLGNLTYGTIGENARDSIRNGALVFGKKRRKIKANY